MSEKINICFASDNNYACFMGIAIMSILKNASKEDHFHFYILDNKISAENKEKISSLSSKNPFEISWLALDEKLFDGCDSSTWSLSTFGRYLIPELIEADKVLYLDCDVMVRGSLADLWKVDLEDCYLAGVLDYNAILRDNLAKRFVGMNPRGYVNAGVLLINNKKWREEKLFHTLLDYSVKNASLLKCPDQDAINYICRKYKKALPERYNAMSYMWKPDLIPAGFDVQKVMKERENIMIRHFHPWKKNHFIPNRDEYLALIKQSPWPEVMPKDDPKWLAYIKMTWRYFWRHPFYFLLPKFWKRLKVRGWHCQVVDY
ncbi:glycosyltransferase family 8 protein [Candidatus Avelusimicrobium sp.]